LQEIDDLAAALGHEIVEQAGGSVELGVPGKELGDQGRGDLYQHEPGGLQRLEKACGQSDRDTVAHPLLLAIAGFEFQNAYRLALAPRTHVVAQYSFGALIVRMGTAV